MSDLTKNLELFVQQLRDGTLPEPSPEMRLLAEQALAAMEARKDEDIEEWAKRLAADVANATD